MYLPKQTDIDSANTLHTKYMTAFLQDTDLQLRLTDIFKKSVGYFTQDDFLYIKSRVPTYLTKIPVDWEIAFDKMWNVVFRNEKNRFSKIKLATFEEQLIEGCSKVSNFYLFLANTILANCKLYNASLAQYGKAEAKKRYIQNYNALKTVECSTEDDAADLALTIGVALSSIELREQRLAYTDTITCGTITNNLYGSAREGFDIAGRALATVTGAAATGSAGAGAGVAIVAADWLSEFYDIGDSIGKWLFF